MHALVRRTLDNTQALALALLVHALAALMIWAGTRNWQPFREMSPAGLTIEAVIVDTAAIQQRQAEAERAAELQAQRERRQQELEQQRQRDAEAERQRQQELEQQRQRAIEQQRQEAERRAEAERQAEIRAEQQRREQERLEQQQRELEEIRQQRAEAERQRRLEEERLKQLEAMREREAEQAAAAEAEAAAQEAAAAAARAERMGTLRERYISAIQSQVTRNWLRPPTAQPGLQCTLKVVQIPGGQVISAAISGRCNADEATRRSLVAAVERAGSLPYRGYEDVFERELEFIFRYDGE